MEIIWSSPTSGTKYSFGQCFCFLPPENTKTQKIFSHFHGVRNRNIDQKWVSEEILYFNILRHYAKQKFYSKD